jgi:hypothetical protein
MVRSAEFHQYPFRTVTLAFEYGNGGQVSSSTRRHITTNSLHIVIIVLLLIRNYFLLVVMGYMDFLEVTNNYGVASSGSVPSSR